MQRFIKAFVRDLNGSWTCVASAEHNLAGGRIQVTPGSRFTRGTMFMGVELAKLLDEQAEEDRRRALEG